MMTSTPAHRDVRSTRYRTATVNGRTIFYREAGDPASPTIVLLHGLPSSSHMFRELLPALADRFHLIAPDYIGFGHSDAPSRDEFAYTFDNLTAHVRGLLDQLRVTSCVLYLHDIGGPIGFRLFQDRPDQVSGLVVQNATIYAEGVYDSARQKLSPLWANRTPETEAAAKASLTAAYARHLWTVGAADEGNINPDNWLIDQALLDRPGTRAYMVDLVENLKTNAPQYPAWQAALRARQPRTLVVSCEKDPLYTPAGADGFLRDLPTATLVRLDAGHFVLDEHVQTVAAAIRSTFAG